ncbi:MAG: Na+/H+ antiporter subunit E [Ignisphaera sp.]|nr:Na+/H+ antiporter subunit E [Ignisphaera sp.]MCX8167874.1 Na+/H+ antiporter subunit E [Ignisphaera sp.]MDW8085485.1 Na+/H+ antiporter subunit E [Ignisphaera sp.]
MGRLGRVLPVSMLAFIVYIVFTGAITVYDVVTGILVSFVIGLVTADITVSNPLKPFDVRRWIYLIFYTLYYFLVAEVRSHIDVIKRILSPRMPINPGIVKIPVRVKSDYSITAVANSITNTPGTVVVEFDESGKYFYVHWIDVKRIDEEGAYKEISHIFEKYVSKVFD